mmetsp:Transcript_83017/g.235502  ORF Transcript_83017/g.235502 Transcript_83017/m.235502 type:complete len:270 (-) Transcript_83017:623-1432(-)
MRRFLLQFLPLEARVVQREPACFHEDALLRVHAVDLRVRQREEVRVEGLDALDLPLVPTVAPARRHCSLLVVVLDVQVDVEPLVRYLAEAVTAAVPHGRPELLMHVGAARITGRQALHNYLLACWRWRAGRGDYAEHLEAAGDLRELELHGRLKEEALQSQGSRGRVVRVIVLVGEEHDHGVGLHQEADLGAVGRFWYQHQLARRRAQEVEDAHLLPAHQAQERIRLPGLRGGGQVARLVLHVGEGELHHEVRPAVDFEAALLQHVRLQ